MSGWRVRTPQVQRSIAREYSDPTRGFTLFFAKSGFCGLQWLPGSPYISGALVRQPKVHTRYRPVGMRILQGLFNFSYLGIRWDSDVHIYFAFSGAVSRRSIALLPVGIWNLGALTISPASARRSGLPAQRHTSVASYRYPKSNRCTPAGIFVFSAAYGNFVRSGHPLVPAASL